MASRRTDRVLALIRQRPGISQDQIACELYGNRGFLALVRRECNALVADGLVRVDGYGVRGRPYVYSPLKRGRPG